MSKPTEVNQFINDLDGGVFTERLSKILSDVAAGVMDHERGGNVTISINMKRVDNTYQIKLDHKVTYKKPTARGDISENNTTATLMHVDVGGEMTLFPKSQVKQGQMHLADRNNPEKLVSGQTGESK